MVGSKVLRQNLKFRKIVKSFSADCKLVIHFSFLFNRTERDWDNSLIIKRVLFEVFDCFLPLFYIAFYQLNVVALRRELVGLFWGMHQFCWIPLYYFKIYC